MKISVDDVELFTLTDVQKNVIKSEIPQDMFDEDMKRRLMWVLMHKYEECFYKLKNQWEVKLKERYPLVPSSDSDLAQLILSQPDYKDGQTIRDENELTRNAAMQRVQQ